MYTKWLLGTSAHGSSAPMNYYLCVPEDGSRPCLLVTCWADGDRFHSAQDAEQALAWDEQHGLRAEITEAARSLLNRLPQRRPPLPVSGDTPLKAEMRLMRGGAGWRATVETEYGQQEAHAPTSNEALGAVVRLLWEGGGLAAPVSLTIHGEDEGTPDANDGLAYDLCARCDHFVDFAEETTDRGVRAGYVHLDDGEQVHDHPAEPSNARKTLAEWRRDRPDLFQTYPDGKVGPNSAYHERDRPAQRQGAEG